HRSGGRADAAAGRLRRCLDPAVDRHRPPARASPCAGCAPPPRWWTGSNSGAPRREGFSLHANVALPAHAREQLEHLCRSLLRSPLATERLTESSGAQLLYQLPHPRRDGSTHRLLHPLELIEQLSVLIPPLRFHLLRFHGVLAPRAQLRSAVVPDSNREAELGGGPAPGASPPEPRSRPSSREGSHGRP